MNEDELDLGVVTADVFEAGKGVVLLSEGPHPAVVVVAPLGVLPLPYNPPVLGATTFGV